MSERSGGFVDIHQHLLHGLDDGPRTFEESLEMLDASYEDGVRTIIATPHVTPGEEPFPLDVYQKRLAAIDSYIQSNSLAIQVLAGAEILYTEATLRLLQAGAVPTLASSRYVLVEFTPAVAYETLFEAARRLANAGYIPVIAHIERYDCLVRTPKHAQALRESINLRLQVNCSTIIRPKGFWHKRFIKAVLAWQAVDYVATDAHGINWRPTCMRECAAALGKMCDRGYVMGLVGGNQREILLQ